MDSSSLQELRRARSATRLFLCIMAVAVGVKIVLAVMLSWEANTRAEPPMRRSVRRTRPFMRPTSASTVTKVPRERERPFVFMRIKSVWIVTSRTAKKALIRCRVAIAIKRSTCDTVLVRKKAGLHMSNVSIAIGRTNPRPT